LITLPGIALRNHIVLILVVASGCSGDCAAQNYPAKPVKIVVPWPAGGGTDTVARIVGQKLSEALGQPFVVENRPGATGMIGAEFVVKSAPDGYTLMAATPPLIYTPSLYPTLRYDPLADFAPISMLVMMPNFLVVNPALPAKSVKELIALAKAHPGKLTYASSGTGSGGHLVAELFKQRAGITMLHVPYKGTAPAVNDTVAGQADLMFADPSSIGLIRAGRLRALAVTASRRAYALPEVPTLIESGLPQFDVWNWYFMVAPAAVPRETIQRLNAEIVRVLQQPEVKDHLTGLGLDPASSTPQALADFMRSERDRWAALIRSAGIKPD
jgi:tripartite-type tricarboxylate transporter receptor subunit TctC